MSDIPRRICIDRMTPAELAIREAVLAVEKVGCDVRLTDAVILLQQAKEKVADFVDKVEARIDKVRDMTTHGFKPGEETMVRKAVIRELLTYEEGREVWVRSKIDEEPTRTASGERIFVNVGGSYVAAVLPEDICVILPESVSAKAYNNAIYRCAEAVKVGDRDFSPPITNAIEQLTKFTRDAALDEVVNMLQSTQTDAINHVNRGNIIDRVILLKTSGTGTRASQGANDEEEKDDEARAQG